MSEAESPIDFTTLFEHPEVEAARVCAINLAALEAEMVRHPGLYAYAAALYRQAKVLEAKAKWDLDVFEAVVFSKLVETMSAARATQEVKTDQGVQRKASIYYDATARTAAYQAVVDGLEHRRDMLVQIAARDREQLRNM